jgi:sulfate adenylyltransferase
VTSEKVVAPQHDAQGLTPPHGGKLVDLRAEPARARELRAAADRWPSWQLSLRQALDLGLLVTGGFSPLDGFLGPDDHASVCSRMRLADGTVWPIPVTLDVDEGVARKLRTGDVLGLRDAKGSLLAVVHVGDVWRPDRDAESLAVFGTTDRAHPGAAHLLDHTHDWYIGGTVEAVVEPSHPDHLDLRDTPASLRASFAEQGWHRVVAFQTRNPMHRAHVEVATRAARDAHAKLLLHPVVGIGKPGDIDAERRVRAYRAVMPYFPADAARLSLLPLAMRMAGPREAVWHAIIRKNHGASHFIVGRDHASPGNGSDGTPFYGLYDAQELLGGLQDELGISMIPFRRVVYVPSMEAYCLEEEVPAGADMWLLSGTEQRRRLAEGLELPSWFTPPEVAAELRNGG